MGLQDRWLILDALYRTKGVAPQTLYDDELAERLGSAWNRLRTEAEYLAQREFIELTRSQRGSRIYTRLRLTSTGLDLVEGRAEDASVPPPETDAAGPPPTWSRPTLRRLLEEAFTDDTLTALCFDYFPAVYDNFAAGMTKGQKILLLLDYCLRHNQVPALLDAVAAANPEQHTRYEAARRSAAADRK